MDKKMHKIMLSRALLSLMKDSMLGKYLIFKGGTCAMFFYGLPRLSVDLDFDVNICWSQELESDILMTLKKKLIELGEITDIASKKNTILCEIRYKNHEKRLKIEISKRPSSGTRLIKNFLGENITIVSPETLFAQKCIALLHRKGITNRDIFDIWFFLSQGTDIDRQVIEDFTGISLEEYLQKIQFFVEQYDFSKALYGLGELIDDTQKSFMKHKMQAEILGYLSFYE